MKDKKLRKILDNMDIIDDWGFDNIIHRGHALSRLYKIESLRNELEALLRHLNLMIVEKQGLEVIKFNYKKNSTGK